MTFPSGKPFKYREDAYVKDMVEESKVCEE